MRPPTTSSRCRCSASIAERAVLMRAPASKRLFFARVWPAAMHAVVSVPDARRGEQLVLVTDRVDAQRAALVAAAREAGLPEMFMPRQIARVARVPILGTGKIDYVGATALASQLAVAS